MERALVGEYEALVEELLASLSADKFDTALKLARLPEQIRGYGHVKLANVATARAKQKDLLDLFHGRRVEGATTAPAATIRIKSVSEL